MAGGVLKLHNIAPWGGSQRGGGIAAYNLTANRQSVVFSPADIPDLEVCERYWVFDFFRRQICALSREERYQDAIEGGGMAWYVLLPCQGRGSCLGPLDKYVGFSAVESIQTRGDTDVVILHESGAVGWAAEKAPRRVMANASDMTASVQQDGMLYTLPLPESSTKMVLSITW